MKSERLDAVDGLKLLAVFGVIVIHLAPSTAGGEMLSALFLLFAIPYFLMVSLYFFIGRAGVRPSFRYSDYRFDRILVPYVVWTVCYILLRLLKLRLQGRPMPFDTVGIVFYGGGAVQLYFLPLLLTLQTMALAVILLSRSHRWKWIGLCLALATAAYGFIGLARGALGFAMVMVIGPLFPLLAFLLVRLQAGATGRKINFAVGLLVAALLLPTVWLGWPLNSLGLLQSPVIGYGIAALGLNWPLRVSSATWRYLFSCSYGIFLAHVGFLEGIEFTMARLGWVLTPYTVMTKIVLGLAISLGCVLFIAAARRHWLPAYLFLGEGVARDGMHRPVAGPAGETREGTSRA